MQKKSVKEPSLNHQFFASSFTKAIVGSLKKKFKNYT
jgi:hypothetical protein